MPKVALLSDVLINKIAAGEVVERPASVVKELGENALDAGAKNIRIKLVGGGLTRIVIEDDGHGMAREDALLALSRHATSKLRAIEDLDALVTMGFRGEALPAIASVSRFQLLTSEPGAAVGTSVLVEGGGPPRVEDAAPGEGTRIQVDDLFFNVPARKKFLRKRETELKHVEDAVLRLALANPAVGFFLENEGRSLLASPGSPELAERVAAALGSEVHRHLVALEERRLGITVTGLVASPEFTLPSARNLYTFVNHRYIRDRGLNFSIQRAYSPLLPPGRQPVGVVFIEIDPATVDVNVHPQKLEVRFADQRGVGDAVQAAVFRAVRSTPWMQEQIASSAAGTPGHEAHYAQAVDRFLTRATSEAAGGGLFGAPFLLAAEEGRLPAFGEARPDLNAAPAPGYFGGLRYVGQLGKRFWLCEGRGATLVVLDAHALHERLARTRLEEALEAALEDERSASPSLFSRTVELPLGEAQVIFAQRPSLSKLGFDLEPFGGQTAQVRAVPPGLEEANVQMVLVELASALPDPHQKLTRDNAGEALMVVACHVAQAAVGTRAPSEQEVRAVLQKLDRADFTLGVSHAKPVVWEMPYLDLERRADSKF